MTTLDGIQFVVNPAGEKTAVMIDLDKYGEVWEDFYDLLIAQMREDEPRESLDEVKRILSQPETLNDAL